MSNDRVKVQIPAPIEAHEASRRTDRLMQLHADVAKAIADARDEGVASALSWLAERFQIGWSPIDGVGALVDRIKVSTALSARAALAPEASVTGPKWEQVRDETIVALGYTPDGGVPGGIVSEIRRARKSAISIAAAVGLPFTEGDDGGPLSSRPLTALLSAIFGEMTRGKTYGHGVREALQAISDRARLEWRDPGPGNDLDLNLTRRVDSLLEAVMERAHSLASPKKGDLYKRGYADGLAQARSEAYGTAITYIASRANVELPLDVGEPDHVRADNLIEAIKDAAASELIPPVDEPAGPSPVPSPSLPYGYPGPVLNEKGELGPGYDVWRVHLPNEGEAGLDKGLTHCIPPEWEPFHVAPSADGWWVWLRKWRNAAVSVDSLSEEG